MKRQPSAPSTPDMPAPLQARVTRDRQRLAQACTAKQKSALKACLDDASWRAELERCWAGSEFAAELCIAHPDWLLAMHDDASRRRNRSQAGYSQTDYARELARQLKSVADEDALQRALRHFRNRALLRIVWRDFNRLANTVQTIRELSFVAETCVRQALDFLHKQLCTVYGAPRNERGEEQELLVLGMGKLGAYELNLSSDIDLIFAYPDEGETDNPDTSISNHEFFIKLGQKLIRALDHTTADGFVFRVDMALRPHGDSGPLACSFDMLESYYQEQGRSWERYAMVKARVIAGNTARADALMALLRPFTYRRYIDFSVVESLRDMKALISRDVKRRGYENNLKLGDGGIREIEFIAQAFQLIRGGRETEFQQRELLAILPLLAQKKLLPEVAVADLTAAYLFLRDAEHALQGFRDEQTQRLPESPEGRARLAFVMGFADWESFHAVLQGHRDRVIRQFRAVAAFERSDESAAAPPAVPEWAVLLWETADAAEQQAMFTAQLARRQVPTETAADAIAALHDLQQSKTVAGLQRESRERLDAFVPRLLDACLATDDPGTTLQRVLPLVSAVLRRSAYLVLLNENPPALAQLVLLSSASPWIADEIAAHPVLLDELLDERTLYTVPDRAAFADALRQDTARLPPLDLEAHMEALRYFKRAHRLRVAACEVTGRLPLMKVSDYLTFLAEVILDHALALAWRTLTARYGYPTSAHGAECELSFLVIGYGKLGGLELGHHSDLDIVFVHGADPEASTNGEMSIDNNTFYLRLAQRLIHILEARTLGGQIYEIDTALRPSGNSGLLVSTWDAFDTYQRESAWTWEHQALVRARLVAGTPSLGARFDALRREILSCTRDPATLRKDVVDMRNRMVQHLGSHGSDTFDLKQDRGGIIDIEFLVQYAVLAWSHDYPQLLRWPDNIRLIEELAGAGLLPADEAARLIDTYKALRCEAHRLALQQVSGKVDGAAFLPERQFVLSLWDRLLGDAPQPPAPGARAPARKKLSSGRAQSGRRKPRGTGRTPPQPVRR